MGSECGVSEVMGSEVVGYVCGSGELSLGYGTSELSTVGSITRKHLEKY